MELTAVPVALPCLLVAFGSRLLVDVLMLHLYEHREHLQHRVAHLCGRVEHVLDVSQGDSVALEHPQHLQDIARIASEPR